MIEHYTKVSPLKTNRKSLKKKKIIHYICKFELPFNQILSESPLTSFSQALRFVYLCTCLLTQSWLLSLKSLHISFNYSWFLCIKLNTTLSPSQTWFHSISAPSAHMHSCCYMHGVYQGYTCKSGLWFFFYWPDWFSLFQVKTRLLVSCQKKTLGRLVRIKFDSLQRGVIPWTDLKFIPHERETLQSFSKHILVY